MKDLYSMGLKHVQGRLLALDQRRLPHEEIWLECPDTEKMIELIRTLAVRGAPLIGVAAALSLARLAEDGTAPASLKEKARALREARPTAVNLMMAVDRVVLSRPDEELRPEQVVLRAEEIFEEDVKLCEAMGNHGEKLIQEGDGILTHCNAGALATAGIGTALGVIRKAHESGKNIQVYVDETRPLLQGARLTAWELGKLDIPHTLICDNMAAMLMRQGKIQRIFVGADRIARNGDFANKIGTYSVAVNAHYHKIPFYTVAPYTTIDKSCPSGAEIPIEERDPAEVRREWAPRKVPVFNPAFDVTSHELVTGYVFDSRVVSNFGRPLMVQ